MQPTRQFSQIHAGQFYFFTHSHRLTDWLCEDKSLILKAYIVDDVYDVVYYVVVVVVDVLLIIDVVVFVMLMFVNELFIDLQHT